MEIEDIYTFYREEIDPEFAVVWAQIADNLDSPDSCDVKVECIDGQYYHLHQSLLSVSSDCFREAFHYYYTNRIEELSDYEELVIGLPSLVAYENLTAIMKYIYTGVVSIPESQVLEFLEVSKFLQIKGLQDIRLVFLNEIDNFNQILISNQMPRVRAQPNYVLELKAINDSNNCDNNQKKKKTSSEFEFQLEDNCDSSSSELSFDLKSEAFTAIKEFANEKCSTNVKKLAKKSPIVSSIKRVGQQGRRPQIGSPLITEEFRSGDRYECKVCLKSYSWKKSLVRHYKDLHLTNVQLVTE